MSHIAPLIPKKILITAYTDVEDVVRLINEGQIHRYIQKPWDSRKLKATIAEAVELYKERLVTYLAEREQFGRMLFNQESEAQSTVSQNNEGHPEQNQANNQANTELANKLRMLGEVRKKKNCKDGKCAVCSLQLKMLELCRLHYLKTKYTSVTQGAFSLCDMAN